VNLTYIFNNESVGLNLSKVTSPTLINLGFHDIKLSVDLRTKTAEQKLFVTLKQYINEGDIVFMVMPQLNIYIPILLTIVYGITKQLPYIVYFDNQNDPKFRVPLISSLPDIKYKSEKATALKLDYYLLA
jgi:hypothetical protein